MAKCLICKRKNLILLSCKFCKNDMCTSCLLPETHKCQNISECFEESKNVLSKDLMNNKVIKEKMGKC